MDKVLLVCFYGALNLLYFPLNKRPVKYYWKLPLDDRLPLWPPMVVIYGSYFLLLFGGGIRLIFSADFYPFIKAMIIAQILGDFFWYFFPNGVKRSEVKGKGLVRQWLRQLYRHDQYDGNAAPSAHVFHTLIISYFLTRLWPVGAGGIYFWAALIIASTVLIKQHYALDVLGGILVATLALSL